MLWRRQTRHAHTSIVLVMISVQFIALWSHHYRSSDIAYMFCLKITITQTKIRHLNTPVPSFSFSRSQQLRLLTHNVSSFSSDCWNFPYLNMKNKWIRHFHTHFIILLFTLQSAVASVCLLLFSADDHRLVVYIHRYGTGSTTVILDLAKDDRIWIQLSRGSALMNAFTVFSGYLLQWWRCCIAIQNDGNDSVHDVSSWSGIFSIPHSYGRLNYIILKLFLFITSVQFLH